MNDRTCKCCGQTLPLSALDIPMADGQKKLVEAVRRAGKHGIATDRLFDVLYGDDIDGGPQSGVKTLHVRVCTVNRLLRKHGYRISGNHTGSRHAYGRYILYRDEVQDAAE